MKKEGTAGKFSSSSFILQQKRLGFLQKIFS
jgi:hypothetical protein